MKDQLMIWGPVALVALAGTLPAFLAGWAPWQIILLAAVVSMAGAVLAAVWAWYAVQIRRAELASLTSDEQASRLLAESLGRCGAFLSGPASQEMWDTFVVLPSDAKRAMALGIVGLVDSEADYQVVPKITALARSFRGPRAAGPEVPTTEEQAARTLGQVLGECSSNVSDVACRQIWEAFAALPGESKRAMAAAVAGFLAAASPHTDEILDPKVAEIVRSFRTHLVTHDEFLTKEAETPAVP